MGQVAIRGSRIKRCLSYLFLARDGVDGVHTLAERVWGLHVCRTDAHPVSRCRGTVATATATATVAGVVAVLVQDDGRRRERIPSLAFEGR